MRWTVTRSRGTGRLKLLFTLYSILVMLMAHACVDMRCPETLPTGQQRGVGTIEGSPDKRKPKMGDSEATVKRASRRCKLGAHVIVLLVVQDLSISRPFGCRHRTHPRLKSVVLLSVVHQRLQQVGDVTY